MDAHTVTSADGTTIAFEHSGDGAPVVLVEPPLRFRGCSAFDGLAPLLAEALTVYRYDRRGRGASTDTAPYAPDREVEDLGALIAAIGEPVGAYGYSGGALLAVRAAANGLPIARLALLEPPLQEPGAPSPDPLTAELAALLAAGRDADAVAHFLHGIGVPEEYVGAMTATPSWPAMVSAAPTLVYDCTISDETTDDLLRSIAVPTLVLDSLASTDDLTGWAATVASRIPGAAHTSLPGEWHTVPDDVLAPVLVDFFRGEPRQPDAVARR